MFLEDRCGPCVSSPARASVAVQTNANDGISLQTNRLKPIAPAAPPFHMDARFLGCSTSFP